MTLEARIIALAKAIGADIKALVSGKLSLNGSTTMTGPFNQAPLGSMAAAATVTLQTAASDTLILTGTATISSFGAGVSGTRRLVYFPPGCTLVHSANLPLPGAVNITTASGDIGEFMNVGGSQWLCTSYLKSNGQVLRDWVPGPWIYLTLINGWQTDNGTAERAKFRKLGPFVQLSVVVYRPAGNSTLSPFFMPVGYRPTDFTAIMGTDFASTTFRQLVVLTTGEASLNNASYDSIGLFGALIYVGN